MKTKFFLAVFTFLCLSNFIYAQNKDGFKKYAQNKYSIKLNGDVLGGEKIVNYFNPKDFNVVKTGKLPETFDGTSFPTDNINAGVTVITYTGATTIYDLVSNGSPVTIWMEPSELDFIHIVCTSSPLDDTLFTNLKSKYYFSNDRGVTWSFVANVPEVKSLFPTITGMYDYSALIANYNIDGGGVVRTQVYKDAAAGLGSFTRLDAPNGGGYLWPRVITTSSLVLSNKFLLVASKPDTTGYNACTGIDYTPGTWLGWQTIPSKQVETYALARGTDGRLGIAFLNDNSMYPSNYGDVYFIQSTNNGTTFNSPLKIFDANFSTDSLAGFRGISIVYAYNVPCVAFETVKQDMQGNYYPGAPSNIRFWSSSLPGTDPNRSVVIADSDRVTFYPYVGVNDGLAPLCRPSIGFDQQGNLFIVFMATSNSVGGTVMPTSFKNICCAFGYPSDPYDWQIIRTNPVSPRLDWSYPSVSPCNDHTLWRGYANVLALVDSIPGTFVNGHENGQSNARYVFMKSYYGIIGINPISTEIPRTTKLFDNYPNPFNPTTRIKFDLSKSSDIKLCVYDLTGREVNRIASGFTKAGTYTTEFDGSNLPSGVYFCKLTTQNSNQTIKLMLLK